MREIAVADVGGTHARFAVAQIEGGRVVSLGDQVKLQTADHGSFQLAWQEFGRRQNIDLPNELALSFAGPVGGEVLKLTNNPWVIRPALMKERLGVDRFTIVNDFGAVGYAVATLPEDQFLHVCGPERSLPDHGVISILGPGTGLGVAALLRKPDHYEVIETEGGHVDFAPLDKLEDQILSHMRRNFRRVSIERLISGRGLWNIYDALATIEGRGTTFHDEKELWTAALNNQDSLANAALDRFCLTLGAVAGDLSLAQGGSAVVIAGGLGLRLVDHLPRSGFRDRFIAKGRFERRMDDMPVKLITYPEPGLFGAAAAFAKEHG
ncbi:glucokinase [Sphingomonas flavescens]|uniref:glucokinase n=1 Tax=Sphingomonas flavescens TaxID=3132797 RepID=UPI0028044E88|nr:glucokinase [Sphingomonas limnosediminicola]